MTREQTLVTYENIRVQIWCKHIWTLHMIRSPMIPSFCRLQLPQPSYRSIKTLQVFLWNMFFAQSCIMTLYWKFQHAWLYWVFANQVTYVHSFKSHFSPPFDRYNNRLTVHAYTIAKASKVYFYWGLIHEPVWCPRVLRWSVNGSNLPGKTDSQQGITTRLASETEHRCSYILWYVGLETAWIDAIWPYKFFCIRRSRHFVAPHHPHPPPL